MESPSGRRSAGLWDAVQAAEDRAVADFLAPAGHALALTGGDDGGAAGNAEPAVPLPTDVANLARRIH